MGEASLTNIVRAPAHRADLGYAIADDRASHVLMTEAVSRVVRDGFGELRQRRIEATDPPSDERSRRLLRRLGFVVEGYARDFLLTQGLWQDMIQVGLIHPPWEPPASG